MMGEGGEGRGEGRRKTARGREGTRGREGEGGMGQYECICWEWDGREKGRNVA